MKKFSRGVLAFLAALIFLVAKVEAAELVIFHTNDMHSRVQDTDDSGKSIGLAEISAAVKAAKAKNPETFWFDAGDTFHGMPRINVNNGEGMATLLNLAGVDAMTAGNHDFNYGSAQLERLAKKIKFPLLDANVVRKKNNRLVFKPYKIFKLKDKTRVGVFGLATPETVYKTNPKNVTEIEFLNPVDTARDMIKKLQPKCDVIVCIMHMGVDASSEFTSERIAREAPGIDVIIDGHSHTELPEGIRVGNTLIAQTGCYEHFLGRVTLEIDDHKIISKKAELLSGDEIKALAKNPDAKILLELKKIDKRNEKLLGEVVAHSDKELTSERKIVRCQESELGNLAADAFRWRTGSDIAIVNGGTLRADLPAGNVTLGDTMAIFPFGNTVRKAEISGKAIRAMLEHSVFAVPAAFGGFVDVSGLTFSFDPTQPAGQRVGEIFIGDAPLDENKTYTISATDFQLAGGDDYIMLKGLKIVGEYDTCEQVLTAYLEEVGGMDKIGVGRITDLSKETAKAA